MDGPITCVEGLVRLERSPALDVDSWAFEHAVDLAQLDAGVPARLHALGLYTDEVLTQQFAYDDTITAYRTALRRSFCGLATSVLLESPVGVDPADLSTLARRAAPRAPEDEELCRAAAHVLARSGRSSEARHLVAATAQALDELGLDGGRFRAETLASLEG